jgi:protein ImuA
MLDSSLDHTDKSARLQELRAQLQTLEKGTAGVRRPLAFGLPALDRHLDGGLPRGCLHEVAGAVDDGAALGFCAVLAGRLAAERPVLWCQPDFDLYAPGLAALGLDPTRLIVVTAPRPADRLWALEEGLRCPALAAAVIELGDLDITAGRRLQLAAEASGVTGFVLHPDGLRAAAANVAVTRWTVTSSAGHGVHCSFSSEPLDGLLSGTVNLDRHPRESGGPGQVTGLAALDSRFRGNDGNKEVHPAGHGVHRSFFAEPLDGPGKWLGPSRWQVELRRCRGGRPGRWLIEWTEGGWRDATGDVALAAALRDRPDPQTARA